MIDDRKPGANPVMLFRPPPPEVRWMLRTDLAAVLAIDHTASPDEAPWTRRQYLDAIEGDRLSAKVAEYEGKVHGVLVFDRIRDAAEIRRFAVRSSLRRRGIGTAMMNWLVGRMGVPVGAVRLTMDVNERNGLMCRFLARNGFRARLVPDGYPATHEDAYRFTREVGVGQLAGPVGKGVMP